MTRLRIPQHDYKTDDHRHIHEGTQNEHWKWHRVRVTQAVEHDEKVERGTKPKHSDSAPGPFCVLF
jgi:hypothetical protein